jgi:hypothetical protein
LNAVGEDGQRQHGQTDASAGGKGAAAQHHEPDHRPEAWIHSHPNIPRRDDSESETTPKQVTKGILMNKAVPLNPTTKPPRSPSHQLPTFRTPDEARRAKHIAKRMLLDHKITARQFEDVVTAADRVIRGPLSNAIADAEAEVAKRYISAPSTNGSRAVAD